MLRRFLPKSLYARVVLIVILPIFLTQAMATYVFFERHWDTVTGNLTRTTAGQIAMITQLYVDAEAPADRERLSKYAVEVLDVSIRFDAGQAIPQRNKLSVFNLYNELFEEQLRERVKQRIWLNTQSWPSYIEVRVQLQDGVLVFFILRDRVFATTGPVFILWLVGTSILLGSIAIVFLRNQVRSILRLANAAEDFGRGRDNPDFRPTGATEVRRAGRAFIAMRERIKRHIDQRTTMLASVSHDLRTPLTRLKLALALQPTDDDLKDMREDVAEMERMVEAYLEFASDIAVTETPERINLAELASETIEASGAEDGVVELVKNEAIFLEGRRTALKRAVANLVNNGVKYADHVWVAVRRSDVHAEVIVDDDGPGIDPDKYADAFKPFERLDFARSQRSPGIGLGLSIVRDAARSHGGDVTLSQSPQGGLRAVFRIPI